MKLRHDPREKMSPRDRARFDGLNDDLLSMDADEIDMWMDANVTSVRDVKVMLKMLTLAVAAMKHNVGKR